MIAGKILLIDHVSSTTQYIESILKQVFGNKLRLSCFQALEQAGESLLQDMPDIIIARIPEKNAQDFWRELSSYAARTPIILLAEAGQKNLAGQFVDSGAYSFILAEELQGSLLARLLRAADRCYQRTQNLHHQKTFLNNIIDNIADGLIIVDAEGLIRFANPMAENFFERGTGSIIGEEFGFPIVAGETADIQLFPTGIIVEMRAAKISWQGKPAYLASLRDVTERRESEEQLRKLSQAVEQSASIVVITDANGKIEYVNEKFTEVTGYTPDEAIGENPRILKSGEMSGKEYEILWETILDGREWRGQFHNKKKNGEFFWTSASIAPVKDEYGYTTHFLAIQEDITERKLAEEAVRFQAQLLDIVAQAVIATDRQGHIIYWNYFAEKLYGWKAEEAIGRLLSDFLAPDLSWQEAINDVIANLIQGDSWSGEMALLRRNGTVFLGEILCSAIYDENQEFIGIVGVSQDITERRIAQQKLADERNLLRTIIDNLPDHVYVKDRKGAFVLANPAIARFMGEDPEKIVGKTDYDFYTEKVAQIYMDTDQEIIRTGEPVVNDESLIVNQNGEGRWILTTKVPLYDSQDTVTGLVGIGRDITELKVTEKDLRSALDKTEALYRVSKSLTHIDQLHAMLQTLVNSVAEALPARRVIITTFDMDEKKVLEYVQNGDQSAEIPITFDELWEGLAGWTLRSGKPALSPKNFDDPRESPVVQKRRRDSESGAIICIPLQHRDKLLGTLAAINLISDPNFNHEDVDLMVAMGNQAAVALENARLYERIRRHAEELEQRVAWRTRELNQKRAQLQAILDSMGEGVIYHDALSHPIINRALVNLTGYTHKEWQGYLEPLKSENVTEEAFLNFMRDIYRRVEEDHIWQGETTLRRKDGSEFQAALICTRVAALEDDIGGKVTLIRDISQEKALQEQKDRFISHASHELRTPITNLKVRLYLIRKQPEKIEEHLDILEKMVERMRNLVDDLLDISRFEKGSLKLSTKCLDLREIIDEVINSQHSYADFKGIALSPQLFSKPQIVCVDPILLTQVFTNLLVNAINYTPKGGNVHITSSSVQEDGQTFSLVAIKDNGIGIPPEMISQIFEPFFRATEGSVRGTGLGLTISKEIIDLHGGEILVESQEGKGSTFTVKLAESPPKIHRRISSD